MSSTKTTAETQVAAAASQAKVEVLIKDTLPIKASSPTKEQGCIGETFERKYYHVGNAFIKRSLRPQEYKTGYHGLYIPRHSRERLMNEAESLQFIQQNTNIPVPKIYCHFEDDQAYYLITEYIPGVGMNDLCEQDKAVVGQELQGHLSKLKSLKSDRLGGPSGIFIPPYRVYRKTKTDKWNLRLSSRDEYVFCHNDLSQHNVIVNPVTLRIAAIIDWEYAGFFPPCFELPFYHRLGPSAAINSEVDDSQDLIAFLISQSITGQADAVTADSVHGNGNGNSTGKGHGKGADNNVERE